MGTTSPLARFESHSHWFTETSLEDSLHLGECLICSNLLFSERRAIHSFLWEGMMSPRLRSAFLEGGGFCARHFWMAKRIEDDGWRSGGVGVAILCENLARSAIENLASETHSNRPAALRWFRRKRSLSLPLPVQGCIFCRDSMARQESLVEILEFLKDKSAWSERLARSPLCMRHGLMALQIWTKPQSKSQLRAALEEYLKQLEADLEEFIRKHDWNHRDEPLGREKDSVLRAIEFLTGLATQFPFQRVAAEGGGENGSRRS